MDIGCGFGQNLFALKNAGYANLHGVDVADEAIAWCKENSLPVEQADIMEYEGERYDFVLMSHVLEHLPKELVIPMLKKIRRDILTKDGQFCVMVPNAMSNTDCYWAYEDFTHNTLFTSGSLLFVLREAGFKNIEFLDKDGLGASAGWKKIVKKLLLSIYICNKKFWNKVTGSAYHAPSPQIFTWEIKCVATA